MYVCMNRALTSYHIATADVRKDQDIGHDS